MVLIREEWGRLAYQSTHPPWLMCGEWGGTVGITLLTAVQSGVLYFCVTTSCRSKHNVTKYLK